MVEMAKGIFGPKDPERLNQIATPRWHDGGSRMKGIGTGQTSGMRRSPELDLPRVLVAGASSGASADLARVLRGAGYVVSTTLSGANVLRDLRSQMSIELLVLDGSETPRVAVEVIEAVRTFNFALPIILIAKPEAGLLAEAERHGVEAILHAPVVAEEIRRAATTIVPIVPEVELHLAG
jgi:CheY-like chemotaxis protein